MLLLLVCMTMYLIRILLLGIIFSSCSLFGQNSRMVIVFQPVFNGQILMVGDSYYKWNIQDSIRLNTCKFYISGICLALDGKLQYQEANSFHLIDADNALSSYLYLELPTGLSYNQILFSVGIDSATNVSGAMGGDLDPTKAMYWTWQSGYINVKLEGNSNLCKTRNNEFAFHLGGYATPYQTYRQIKLDVQKSDTILVAVDVAIFFHGINMTDQQSIMSPGREASNLSELFIKAFAIKPI